MALSAGKGNYDWNALPEGLYLIEWRAGRKRRRASAGVTAAQALEAQVFSTSLRILLVY